ncbi:MAG: prepilin-type N-terminal cleavage/methylation domain-containing protein [Rubripirellula sp.]
MIKPCRNGFSLLEILLALAILGGAMAMLSQIAETGTSAAREARDLSVARLMCQSKLSETLLDVASGISPQTVLTTPLASFDSGSMTSFNYSLEVQPGQMDGLLILRITVVAESPNGGPALATYSLTRWVVDPTLGLEAAEAEAEALKSLESEEAAL